MHEVTAIRPLQLDVVAGGFGEVPKWPKGADCKSAGARLRGFKSSPPHHLAGKGLTVPVRTQKPRGNSSAVERQPSKLGVAGSNPVSRSSLTSGHGGLAHVAQSAEHVLGKDGVTGSSPVMGSSVNVVGRRERRCSGR